MMEMLCHRTNILQFDTSLLRGGPLGVQLGLIWKAVFGARDGVKVVKLGTDTIGVMKLVPSLDLHDARSKFAESLNN